jgi:hypothetical protein
MVGCDSIVLHPFPREWMGLVHEIVGSGAQASRRHHYALCALLLLMQLARPRRRYWRRLFPMSAALR